MLHEVAGVARVEEWRIAPILAETRRSTAAPGHTVPPSCPAKHCRSLGAFASALQAERMTDAVMDSTRRIFDLITAIKDYSYMDQAPIQEIDLREALDNT